MDRWWKGCLLLLAGAGLVGFSGCGTNSAGVSKSPPPAVHNEWTWVGGANTADLNQVSVYGTKGVASSSNMPGGRTESVTWTDASGNFWLFGGYQAIGSSDQSDLWKYSPSTEEWTWVSGSNQENQAGVYGTPGKAAPGNMPGGREMPVSWVGPDGSLWLFGGLGRGSQGTRGILDDLWKYNPASNEWTWMSGADQAAQPGIAGAFQGTGVYGTMGVASPQNVPGARWGAMAWTGKDGNLWLFGGYGINAIGEIANMNDLWKYDLSTNEWTWMSGASLGDQYGVYGTKGVASASNVPGGRIWGVTWSDAQGNLWLFGGNGGGATSSNCDGCQLNDLWKYDTATNEWTWVNGSDADNQPGVYGTQGVASPENVPDPRQAAVSWVGPNGDFWLFGGIDGFGKNGGYGTLNDLWKYNPSTNEWTWMNGSDSTCPSGDWGIQGTPSSANVPNGRNNAVGWVDASGNLWLFSGDDFCNADGVDNYNDLWEYTP